MHTISLLVAGAALFTPLVNAVDITCDLWAKGADPACSGGDRQWIDSQSRPDNTVFTPRYVFAESPGMYGYRLGSTCTVSAGATKDYRIYFWNDMSCKGAPLGSMSLDDDVNASDTGNTHLDPDSGKNSCWVAHEDKETVKCFKYALAGTY